jgi:hypothetical protein
MPHLASFKILEMNRYALDVCKQYNYPYSYEKKLYISAVFAVSREKSVYVWLGRKLV